MAEFTCKHEGCGKSFRTKGARALHEMSHQTKEKRPCPDCGKLLIERFLPRHQRMVHGRTGRKVIKKVRDRKTDSKPPPQRRSLSSIVEELHDSVVYFEKEFEVMKHRLDARDERLTAVQRLLEEPAIPIKPQVPRR